MYSRAHLLIQKEINELSDFKDISITRLNDDNIFELIALIQGPPRTIWENGTFQIYIKFSENYNFTPPKVYFQTVPFHPNIDITTGKPSLDFLDDLSKWKSEYNLKHILKSLQHLLANPLLDRSVNMDAVFMLKGNPDQYELLVKQSVNTSQKIREILKEKNENLDQNEESLSKIEFLNNFHLFKFNKEPTEIIRNETDFEKYELKRNIFKNISYEEYCNLWKGIATTKSNNNEENIYLKSDLFSKPNLMSQHISISIRELEEQINKQLNEHKNIMYGKFDFGKAKTKKEEKSNKKLDKVKSEPENLIKTKGINYNDLNKVKKVDEKILSIEQESINLPVKKISNNIDDDLFEQEVDDLIEWTKNIE